MNTAYRTRLLASTLLIGAGIASAPASAQIAPQTDQTVAQAEGAPIAAEEIVVTGSLIRNPNLIQSSPVNSVSSEELELRQTNVAEQFLRELPGVVPSIGSAVNNGNGGSSFVDLRGLGANRNLVLLDGRRIAPAGLDGITDLNNIPLALIERTDILTGGASTTYGADAVSGVVNFITKRDFAGVEATASQQITERGDGNIFRGDLTIGANFDDGRGNAVFSIGYQKADPVLQGDRDYSAFNIDSYTGAQGGSGTAVPGRFNGLGLGTNNQIDPVTGRFVPTYSLFNFNPQNIFQTPFDRFNMFGAAHYEVADGIEVYSRGLFSKNTVQTVIASSGTFGNSVVIPYSNPYLPGPARGQICAANGLTTAQCDAAAAALSPTDPNYRTFTTTASRRFVEAGPRLSTYTTTIFDYTAGVRGDITSTVQFDVSGGYGESENAQRQSGNGTLTRVRQAVLATSTDACLDPSNGCVPLNLFGAAGSITPDQLGFLLGVTNGTTTKTTLGQARGVVSGDFGFSSPFASESIAFAIGAEYRKYTAAVVSDELTQRPNEVLGNGAASPDVSGSYDVREGFAELIVPLVADKPFFHSLTLEAGGRVSSYSTAGTNWTWKAGGTWEPVRSLKIRGNYQKAARAPNIGELFAPVVTGLDNSASDPCSGPGVIAGSALGTVCAAQIVAGGATPAQAAALLGNIDVPSAGQVNVRTGGNPDLGVETAKTWTVGGVFQPDFVPGFSASVDYYNIKVSDAITSPTVGDVFNACYSPLQSATSPGCASIGRDPIDGSLNGAATGLALPLSNLGRIETDGIDVALNYSRRFGFGGLALSFIGNWTNSNRFQATPTSVDRECVGYYSVNCASIQPEFSFNQRTTISIGSADISLLWRYVDAVQYEPAALADDIANGGGPLEEFRRIGAEHYFDLTTRFGVTDNFDFTLSALNLFDNQPKVVGASIGSTAYNSGNVYPSTYDALGRRFAASARLRF